MAKPKHPYFRVRLGWSTSPYTLELSGDGARVAVIRLWDKAKPLGGTFGSEGQLRDLMGRYARYIPELREKGWLDGLDVHDWDEDQSDQDPTRAERQRRFRARRNGASNAPSNGGSNGPVTRPKEKEKELTPTGVSKETPPPPGRQRPVGVVAASAAGYEA